MFRVTVLLLFGVSEILCNIFDPFAVQRAVDSQFSASQQPQVRHILPGAGAVFDLSQASLTNIKPNGHIAQPSAKHLNVPVVPFDPFREELRNIIQPGQIHYQPQAKFTQSPLVTNREPRPIHLYPVHPPPTASRRSSGPGDVVRSESHVVPHATVVYPYSHHGDDHSASKSSGGGHKAGKGFHQSHGDDDKRGYKSDHHHDVAEHGKHNDKHKASHYDENGGHVNKHHDEAGHYKNYQEGEKSHKSAKFGEKKGHKRGHKTKGYHNKFHRDEYHREHRFYDDAHKEGYHEKHGKAHSKYKKEEGAHKDGAKHKSGGSEEHHGKEGVDDKGHVDDEHKGYTKESGKKKYHKHYSDHGVKKGSSKGRKYGYAHGDKE